MFYVAHMKLPAHEDVFHLKSEISQKYKKWNFHGEKSTKIFFLIFSEIYAQKYTNWRILKFLTSNGRPGEKFYDFGRFGRSFEGRKIKFHFSSFSHVFLRWNTVAKWKVPGKGEILWGIQIFYTFFIWNKSWNSIWVFWIPLAKSFRTVIFHNKVFWVSTHNFFEESSHIVQTKFARQFQNKITIKKSDVFTFSFPSLNFEKP